MTYKTRKFLFIIFSFLFCVITPVTILYAAGYKIDFTNLAIKKTGALILETEPKGAVVYLDNEPIKSLMQRLGFADYTPTATPARIKNLLPGDYELKLELQGHWEWRKKITIKPNETTIFNDILMLKKDIPLIIFENASVPLFYSPDFEYAAAYDDNKTLKIINLSSEEILDFTAPTGTPAAIEWSRGSNAILVDKSEYFNLGNNSLVNIKSLLDPKTGRIKFASENAELIHYNVGKNIYSLDIRNGKISLLFSENDLEDFIIDSDSIVTAQTSKANNNITVNIYDLNSKKLKRKVEIPSSKRINFINQESPLINLYDEERQVLYLIDPDSFSALKETINNVKASSWINENTILYFNDYEIWTYDKNSNRKNILTRISEKINKALWHPSGKYVLYNTDNAIYSFEPGSDDKYNIAELAKFQKISDLMLNEKGDQLYFYGEIGNQRGIYKLGL